MVILTYETYVKPHEPAAGGGEWTGMGHGKFSVEHHQLNHKCKRDEKMIKIFIFNKIKIKIL